MASSSNTGGSSSAAQQATLLWQKQAKCNAEFFALTYGSLVAELLRDLEDAPQIQAALDRMGHRCVRVSVRVYFVHVVVIVLLPSALLVTFPLTATLYFHPLS